MDWLAAGWWENMALQFQRIATDRRWPGRYGKLTPYSCISQEQSETGTITSWGSTRDGQQALTERGPKNAAFQRMDDRKNYSVEYDHGTDIEVALLEKTKIEPPGEVANAIKIIQPDNLKAGLG